MDNVQIAKNIVGQMTGFAVGSASMNIFRSNVSPSENPALDLLVKASVFVGSWAVSGTVMKPVRVHTDQKVDEIAAALSQFKKS